MSKLAPNPFKFGDPVQGDFYLSRPGLEQFVSQFLSNSIPVVLIGPRRIGKTSFLLSVLKKFEKENKPTLFVDVFNITSHRDFLHQFLRAFRQKQSKMSSIKETLSKVRPSLSAGIDSHTGYPAVGFTLESAIQKDVKEAIQNVLAGLAKYEGGIIVAIDEFQKIAEIDDEGWLEATLRTHVQHLKNSSFIFTGSRRSVIYDMLNNPKRPLYRFCQPIEFPNFGEEFSEWIIQRFSQVGIKAERSAIDHLRNLVQDTPNYVQMVCFHLVAQGIPHVTIAKVEEILKIVVRQNAYAYQTLLNSLTPIQQRVLRLAAIESKQIFSRELHEKYEISSGAAMASAIKALKDKEVLDEEASAKGIVVFDDPLFAIWLKSMFNDL